LPGGPVRATGTAVRRRTTDESLPEGCATIL